MNIFGKIKLKKKKNHQIPFNVYVIKTKINEDLIYNKKKIEPLLNS